MPELCDLLNIQLSELFRGERMTMEAHQKAFDALLLEMKQREEAANRRILQLEKVLVCMTIAVSLTMILGGCYLAKDHLALGIVLWAFGIAVVFATCFVGVKTEHDAGYYECPECGERYIPTMKAVVKAPHRGTARKMTCPFCGKCAYHQKVLAR